MSKYIPGNQKHLTLNDRIYIENELAKGTTFKDIAAFLCKDPTTISKEVRSHRVSDWYHKGTFYNVKNFCMKHRSRKPPNLNECRFQALRRLYAVALEYTAADHLVKCNASVHIYW